MTLVTSSRIFPSLFSFGGDRKKYQINLSGDFAEHAGAKQFREMLASKIGHLDYELYIDTESSFDIFFRNEDCNEIVSVFNSLVKPLKIKNVKLVYIKNKEHEMCLDKCNEFRFVYDSSYLFKYKDMKYYIACESSEEYLKNMEVMLKKLGFVCNSISQKTYTKTYISRRDKSKILACIDVFANNLGDLFPLKCVYKDFKIFKLKYFNYEYLKPITY